MKTIVLGITGRIGAGKDTAGEYLVQEYGFTRLNFGDAIREVAHERGEVPTRENLHRIGKAYRDEFGLNYWPQRLLDLIQKRELKKVVLTGLRFPREVQLFRDFYAGHYTQITIGATLENRFKYISSRARVTDPKDFEVFKKQNEEEQAIYDFNGTLALSDAVIDNNGSLENFYAKIDRLMNSIGVSKA